MSEQIHQLHEAMTDIQAVLNSSKMDADMVRAAEISLDRALFPLLAVVGRRGPIGIVDLADRVGRDHTTVSRQVSKLEQQSLVERRTNAKDRRIREVNVTDRGRAMTDRIDLVRERIGRTVLTSWEAEDVTALVGLLRKLADAMQEMHKRDGQVLHSSAE